MDKPRRRIGIGEFLSFLRCKPRSTKLTKHASSRMQKRELSFNVVEHDLRDNSPVLVFEQESEVEGERKFDVYYRQAQNIFHRYVIALNNEARIITLMRTSKLLQKMVAGENNGPS